jgi:hydroxyacylglutathione hydrolase
MTLEDHLGDVIRKAREGQGISAEKAAQASSLRLPDYAKLEETGQPSPQINWNALAGSLGLDARKLEALSKGWHPQPADLSLWRELRPISSRGLGMSVNCYLVWDEVTREAALFDTGFDAGPILKLMDEEQLQLKHIFLTHTHEDHIAALGTIRERFPKARLHSSAKSAPVDQRNRANDFIHLGSLRISNRDTPGHAEDGMTYIVGNFPEDAPSIAVVGDALFAGSMGGARQAFALARQKIREQIFTLPPDTLLCPGHGPLTTVREESLGNPFF